MKDRKSEVRVNYYSGTWTADSFKGVLEDLSCYGCKIIILLE
jgi:hypothetical protein